MASHLPCAMPGTACLPAPARTCRWTPSFWPMSLWTSPIWHRSAARKTLECRSCQRSLGTTAAQMQFLQGSVGCFGDTGLGSLHHMQRTASHSGLILAACASRCRNRHEQVRAHLLARLSLLLPQAAWQGPSWVQPAGALSHSQGLFVASWLQSALRAALAAATCQ